MFYQSPVIIHFVEVVLYQHFAFAVRSVYIVLPPNDILIKDVGYDFIANYDIYLRSTCNCQHNTAVRHIRYLKQITTDAIKCNSLQVDPFIDFTLSSKRGDRKYLTELELKQIMEKDFASDKLREVRDIFIFCCFSDVALMRI